MAEAKAANLEKLLTDEKEPAETTFDEILEIVGSEGRFQNIFNWLFNFGYGLILSMSFMNYTLAIVAPDHWCHVPRTYLNTSVSYENLTIEQWRNFTVPLMETPNGLTIPSQCNMFIDPLNNTNRDTQKCQFGWEYNKTWYETTLASHEDWVCEKEYIPTDSLVATRVGEFFGTIIFGVLGDTIGRRPIFVFTIVAMVLGRLLIVITSSNYYLLLASSAFGALTINTGFQSPLTIAMEISSSKLRATIASLQYLGWTMGLCILPMFYWVIRRWDYFLIVTTVPGISFLFLLSYMIESPRWLMSQGKADLAFKQLKKIAKVNNRPLPDNFKAKLIKMSLKVEPTFSMIGLFNSWRLAKNTIILCICWSSAVLCYYVLLLNFQNLAGNPHLNFLLMALVEFPSNLIGKLSCDRYGRRGTMLIANSFGILTCASVLLFFPYSATYPTVMLVLMNVMKFFITFAFYVLNLQSIEVYPTCARQSGTSVSFFCAMGVSVFGPYLAKAGKFDARIPTGSIGICLMVAGFCASFLPETKNVSLPETFEEAKKFGADQSYWNFFSSPSSPGKKEEGRNNS